MLQTGNFLTQSFETFIGQFADAGGFQRHGRADMLVAANRIHAHEFTGQMQTDDLIATIAGAGKSFQAAGAHRENGHKRIADAVEIFAFIDRAAAFDDFVEFVQIAFGQPHGHAQLKQAAALAAGADFIEFYNTVFWHSVTL